MGERSLLELVLAWSALATALSWLPWPRWRPLLVAACGECLLAMVSPWSFALLATASAATYALHRYALLTKTVLIIGIAAIAGTYLVLLGLSDHSVATLDLRIVLPLGIAFYALRLIHYLFESYKGSLRPHSLTEYLCYQFLPGTLPAGPIHRFDEFLRDLRRRRWDSAQLARGAQRVLYGLAKIVALGNYLIGEELAPLLAQWDDHPLASGYFSVLLFWARLYVLFSGYSDIAIGFAALMGLNIRENFDWPMLARNIVDFWQRWHVSLSSWCRDYIFTPVLSVTRRPFIAVLAAMIVLGLWHDLSLRYLLWGAYHGTGIAAFRWFDAKAGYRLDALPPGAAAAWRAFATALTLHFVLFSFWITHALERVLTSV